MAYLGNDLQVAFPSYRNIDDISGSFDGVTTSFPLTVDGVAPIPAPINSQQCLISVNGVVQKPDDSGTEGFRLSGGNIIFASAPAGGVDFFGVILAGADYINVGANFPSGSAAAPSITFDSDLDTGIYNPAGNQIGFSTAGTQRLVINSSGQISSGLGTAAAPAFSFISDPNTGLYAPGADQVAISTNGTQRINIEADGDLIAGTSSNYAFIRPWEATTGNLIIGTDQSATGTGGSATIFRNRGSETLRITSGGLVGIGTSSPSAPITCQTSGASLAVRTLLRLENTVSGGAGGVGVGSSIDFYDEHADGLLVESARIASEVTDGAGSSRVADLSFYTTSSGAGAASVATEKVRITGGGSVGIGTTQVDSKLVVAGNNDGGGNQNTLRFVDLDTTSSNGQSMGRIEWYTSDTDEAGVKAYIEATTYVDARGGTLTLGTDGSASGAQNIIFKQKTNEVGRFDTSGRLLVGTSSSSETARAVFQGNSASNPGRVYFTTASAAPSSGASLAKLIFADSGHVSAAEIDVQRDGGTWTSGSSQPSCLVFSTTADGASSPTERMRINNAGKIGIGSTIDAGGVQTAGYFTVYSNATGASSAVGAEFYGPSTSTRYHVTFANPNGIVGYIYTSASATTYNTSSDYRLKENVKPLTGAIDRVSNLKPCRFNFIVDPSVEVDGFLAHEAQEVVPQAVDGYKDAVDEEGKPQYQGIDHSKLVPLLTAALQELVAEVESLKAEVAALKAS